MKASRHLNIRDCYRILNVAPGTAWPEIRKSFLSLARQYHPDCNSGDPVAEERFKLISNAYEILERWNQSRPLTSPVYVSNANAGDGTESQILESGETLHNDSGSQGWVRWQDWLWSRLQRYERLWLQRDVEKQVTVDSQTVALGGTIRIKNASGSFLVEVPPKTQEGTILRIPGKGEAGFFDPVRGDLLLKIKLSPVPKETTGIREFFYTVRISRESLVRPEVRILKTHEGLLRYRLPRDTKEGQGFVLKSGPHPATGITRHHIIVVNFL